MFTFLVTPERQYGFVYLLILFLLAYTGHGTGFEGIKNSNVEILENAVQAVENLCPNLLFWTFQTGGKVRLS
jgi:hypothetical protein